MCPFTGAPCLLPLVSNLFLSILANRQTNSFFCCRAVFWWCPFQHLMASNAHTRTHKHAHTSPTPWIPKGELLTQIRTHQTRPLVSGVSGEHHCLSGPDSHTYTNTHQWIPCLCIILPPNQVHEHLRQHQLNLVYKRLVVLLHRHAPAQIQFRFCLQNLGALTELFRSGYYRVHIICFFKTIFFFFFCIFKDENTYWKITLTQLFIKQKLQPGTNLCFSNLFTFTGG